jgi:hypothetical protein
VDIWLELVPQGDNPPIWLFSKEALRLVPEVGLAKTQALSVPLWRWYMLLAAVPLILLLGSLVARFLKLLNTILASRMLGDKDADQAHVAIHRGRPSR